MSECQGFLKFPKIYDFQNKISIFLNRINVEDINPHIIGKTVLDIGCGPNFYYYSSNKAKFCIGLDISEKFIQSVKKGIGNHQKFIQGDAGHLPFKSKSSQVGLLLFTLHHIPIDHGMLLEEAARCCTEKIIIIDHLQDKSGFRRYLKSLWWKIKDKGFKYNTYDDWKELLEPYHVTKEIITGGPLKNIYQVIISLNK
jgi:ubiquinone/menaquinone biosynthesis C-methylase UbiE